MDQHRLLPGRGEAFYLVVPHRLERMPHFLGPAEGCFHDFADDPEAAALQKLEGDVYFSGDRAQLLLQKALLTLPEKQRMVFNLKYYQEIKYEEMSEIFGTSVGALKASYHHAVKKIEKFLADEL